jgi:hypothetical protein
MEMDSLRFPPHNLEGPCTRIDDSPLNDMLYTIHAHTQIYYWKYLANVWLGWPFATELAPTRLMSLCL